MNDKKNEWERRLVKVLLPIIASEEELTLEALSPGQTVDEFTCSVDHIEEDVAYLRLRGETDGELRDFGLEYSLHQLKAQIPNVSEGMMLKCVVKDNLKEVSLYFQPFISQPLPLEKRKALQEKYNQMFKDFEGEDSSKNAEAT